MLAPVTETVATCYTSYFIAVNVLEGILLTGFNCGYGERSETEVRSELLPRDVADTIPRWLLFLIQVNRKAGSEHLLQTENRVAQAV